MPLIQSGVSLVVSSIVTSGLGFLFWIIAARQYSSADLGIGSAVITAMILLADFSQIGLRIGLVRFLPNAGADTRRLITNCYLLATAIAALGAIVFVAGIHVWTPELIGLRESIWSMVLFVLATMFWVLFLLEDSVLLGLRLTRWVPIENGIFGVLKILLLFPLAAVSDEFGVFLAWALPVFVIVVAVNVLVARRVGDEGPKTGEPNLRQSQASTIVMRDVLSYSLIDWAASAARIGVIGVLPLIVLAELGSAQSAYYFLAWTITYSVYILSANIGDALVAEASYDEGNVDRHTLHSGLLSMAISGPVVLVAAVLAPWFLRAFGAEYSNEATTVLRLLLLGAIPNVVTRTYVGRLRAERRMKSVFMFEFALSISILVVGWVLLGAMGIEGLGLAWLIMLSVAALYVLAVESIGWWAPKLDTGVVRSIARVLDPLRRVWMRVPSPGLDREVRAMLSGRYQTRPRWRRAELRVDSQTIDVAGHEGRPPLRAEISRTEVGAEALGRRVSAATDLGKLPGLAALRALVPLPIEHDASGEHHVLIESAISGRRGDLIGLEQPIDDVVEPVIAALSELHRATAGCISFDHDVLNRRVSQPLRNLGDVGGLTSEDIVSIGKSISEAFSGLSVPSAHLHGSLTLDRTRFDKRGNLTGLLDWGMSGDGPGFLDWGSLALSALSVQWQQDLGRVVAKLLEQPAVFLNHRAFSHQPAPAVDPRALVLLSWLHVMTPALRATSVSGPAARFWLARNVQPVVAGLAHEQKASAR